MVIFLKEKTFSQFLLMQTTKFCPCLQLLTHIRLEEFQKTKSRIVISSGGLEPVLDGFGNGNSIFANEFISLLNKSQGAVTSTEIYSEIRDRVVEKSIKMGNKQVPFMGTLVGAGHEGPDFVLIPD